jgi:hypothetical protein
MTLLAISRTYPYLPTNPSTLLQARCTRNPCGALQVVYRINRQALRPEAAAFDGLM